MDKQVLDLFEKAYPDLWRRCYPRIYEEPTTCGQFYSAKKVGFHLLGVAMRLATEGGIAGASQQTEIVWASRLANYRVPLYWVGHDMSLAIQQTVPPVELNLVNTPLPFEAMAFMVPKGCLPHENSDEAVFASFVRVKKGDVILTLSPGGPREYHILNDAFSCFATTTDGELMHWTYAKEDMEKLNLAKLDTLVQEFAHCVHSSFSMFSSQLTLSDNRFMARVSHFIFGTLLLMLARPNLITTGALLKKVPSKAGTSMKEFWSPNVFGKTYRIHHEPQGGSHASPKFHWVRGALKQQPYGEKSVLRKEIWVEPYTRGVEV